MEDTSFLEQDVTKVNRSHISYAQTETLSDFSH